MIIYKEKCTTSEVIIVNTKNYKTGKNLLNLAKKIQKFNKKIIIAVPLSDINSICKNTKLDVYAQHIDYVKSKKSTGFTSVLDIKSQGAKGTLLNHSEHRLESNLLKKLVRQCKENGIKTIVCVKDLKEAKKVSKFQPYAIALEEKSLIGSGKSITDFYPKEIEQFAKLCAKKKIISICGAGISSIKDVKQAYTLGCKGVLIASAIADSKHPDKLLKKIRKF